MREFIFLLSFNVLAWPVIHLLVSWITLRIPDASFHPESRWFRLRGFEKNGKIYETLFSVKRWKGKLPDGAPWIGSDFRKARITERTKAYFMRFQRETCRAEMAHWCTLAFAPVFLWKGNPSWAVSVHFTYAIAANLPCIVVQRYNRGALGGILARKGIE